MDDGLEENLRTFFEQDYAQFEILFAVRTAKDPAIQVVERLCASYPHIPARLHVTGEPPYPNAKVFSLDTMLAAARIDLIVMADSDTRVTPDMLSALAGEFQNPHTGLATCPYRAVPGHSFWSVLEALGLNTEFIGGVLMARMLDGMKFAIGPTIAARRETLESIGGFDAVKDFLAEDFVMGKLAAECGCGVILSSYVIEHRIGAQRYAGQHPSPAALGAQHAPLASVGICRATFHPSVALGIVGLVAAPAWWPVAAASGRVAFRLGLGHGRSGLARPFDAPLLVDVAGAGHAELRSVDRRIFRQHDCLARAQILPAARWALRVDPSPQGPS